MKINKPVNNKSLLIAAVLWLIAITFILVIILLSVDSFYVSIISAGVFLAAMIASLSSRDKVFGIVTLLLLPVMAAIALPGYIDKDSLYMKSIMVIEIVSAIVLFLRSLWVIYQELRKRNES